MKRRYAIGQPIVYTKEKAGAAPGQRARNVMPAAHGEIYSYEVDKYWRVIAVHPDGSLQAITRSGKVHRLEADDPHLRHASWWERFMLHDRFPGEDEQALPNKTEVTPSR